MSASTLNWKDYFLQVSLIILSLFIAFGVDRCNEGLKDNGKRKVYLAAIDEELKYELKFSRMNLSDNENDIEDLKFAIDGFTSMEPTRLPEAIGRTGQVFARGVFRTFPPMNFELMNVSGDGLLLEDLSLRQNLSSVATFRNDYVKGDLMRYDEMTLEALSDVSKYLDVYCVRDKNPEEFTRCITNLEKLRENGTNDLTALRRQSEVRAYHLGLYISLLEEVIPKVEQAH